MTCPNTRMPRSPSAPRIFWTRRATTAGCRKSCTRFAKRTSRNIEGRGPALGRFGHEHPRQWNDCGQDGAADGGAANVPIAAERHDAVSHRGEAVRGDGLEPIRRYALAVVRNA